MLPLGLPNPGALNAEPLIDHNPADDQLGMRINLEEILVRSQQRLLELSRAYEIVPMGKKEDYENLVQSIFNIRTLEEAKPVLIDIFFSPMKRSDTPGIRD